MNILFKSVIFYMVDFPDKVKTELYRLIYNYKFWDENISYTMFVRK